MTSESHAEIERIASWLAGHTGISTRIIGVHALRRAIGLRQQATGLTDASAYLDELLQSADEQQSLVELVVVPETWFFRDRHPFQHLGEHLAPLLQQGGASQPLRLLSAPCASGEEPYSMAMTLLDLGLPEDAFKIDAIDICRQSIRKARRAVYSPHSFRGVSEAEKQKYFTATAEGMALHPEIRRLVHFKRANLMHCLAETSGQYDVIFCRNLLIYLEDKASQHLLEALAGLLKVGGLLLVGAAEAPKVPPSLFRSVRAAFVFGFLRQNPADIAAPLPPPQLPSPVTPQRREGRSGSPRSAGSTPTNERRRAMAPAVPRSRPPRQPVASRGAAPLLPPDELDLRLYRQQLDRDPYAPAPYLQMGQWFLRHNRFEEAMDSLQRCLYLQPDSSDALRALIHVCKQLGQTERSRQFQGRLARLDP